MTAPEPYEKGLPVAYTIRRRGAHLAGTGTILHRHPNADSWSYAIRSAVDPSRVLFASHEELTPTGESQSDATAQALAKAGLNPNVFGIEKTRAEAQADLDAFDLEFGTVLARTLAVMAAHENLVKAVRTAAHFDPALNAGIRAAWVHLAEVDPKAVTL